MTAQSMNSLENKVAVITGSTYGIGQSVAEVLAGEGVAAIITGRSEKKGREVAEGIRERGGAARYYYLDVTEESTIEELFEKVDSEFGGLDILINNAGVSGPNKPTHKYTKEEWQWTFEVNVTGAAMCTKHAIPYLKKADGASIVYMSSIYGIVGAPDVPAYHATKAANRNMAKIDALLYAEDGIRVNSVHPGFIRTPMVEDFLQDLAEKTGRPYEEIKEELDSRHPIGHIGEPEDIAHGVRYLVSEEAKFVTGSELVIDGGYTSK